MNEIQPALAIQIHAEDRCFHLGWFVNVPGQLVAICPACNFQTGYGIALMGATAGSHATLEQLEAIWIELSAMLYSEEAGLLEVDDTMGTSVFWATYSHDPRTPEDVNAWWIGIAGAAFAVDQHDVVQLVEMMERFIRWIKDRGWESFKKQEDREPVSEIYQNQQWAFED